MLIKILVRLSLIGCFILPIVVCAEESKKVMSIGQFLALNATTGIYRVEGFVAKKYTCPYCPPTDQCKPCMRDHILLSELAELLDVYPPNGNFLVVFTQASDQLQKNVHYIMTLRVLQSKTNRISHNDVELVNFSIR